MQASAVIRAISKTNYSLMMLGSYQNFEKRVVKIFNSRNHLSIAKKPESEHKRAPQREMKQCLDEI